MIGTCISTSSLLSIPNAYLVILPIIMIFLGPGGWDDKKHVNEQQKEKKCSSLWNFQSSHSLLLKDSARFYYLLHLNKITSVVIKYTKNISGTMK